MTEINASSADIHIRTANDVRQFYTGTNKTALREDAAPKIGIEIEQTLYNPSDLSTVTGAQSEALVAQGKNDGVPVHHEPSATSLEVVTDPFTAENLTDLLSQTENRFSYYRNLIREHGFVLSPFGHLPHVFPEDHDIVDKERYQTFFNPPRPDMEDVFRFFANAMNIQVSISYRDADHLLQIVRMATALEPLLFLTTNSDCGFFENQPVDYCLPLHLNAGKGRNGGIPDFYYTAQTGEEFVESHIDFTLNHPHVFAYFNENGRLEKTQTSQWVCFGDLEKQGLGPQNMTNYRQAQSESWRRAVNIATIDDEHGTLVGHRAEIASFQTGLMHQRVTGILVANLIAFNPDFQEKTAAILQKAGISLGNLAEGKHILEKNVDSAVYHGNTFTDVPFGNTTIGALARDMADIVETCYAGTDFEQHVQPLLHIWRSGRPDWLVYREQFKTLEDVKTYLKEFPQRLADNPALISTKSCADIVLNCKDKSSEVA